MDALTVEISLGDGTEIATLDISAAPSGVATMGVTELDIGGGPFGRYSFDGPVGEPDEVLYEEGENGDEEQ